METAGIVCGSLVAFVILVLVSLCVVKKWKLLSSYKTRRASSNPNNLLSFPCEPPVADSDLNGLYEQGISSIQCSQIVKRPPEIGEFVYMYVALTCFFFLLQPFLCFIASRYCMFFILGNPVNCTEYSSKKKHNISLRLVLFFPFRCCFAGSPQFLYRQWSKWNYSTPFLKCFSLL